MMVMIAVGVGDCMMSAGHIILQLIMLVLLERGVEVFLLIHPIILVRRSASLIWGYSLIIGKFLDQHLLLLTMPESAHIAQNFSVDCDLIQGLPAIKW